LVPVGGVLLCAHLPLPAGQRERLADARAFDLFANRARLAAIIKTLGILVDDVLPHPLRPRSSGARAPTGGR
jgi:hypothetical protein